MSSQSTQPTEIRPAATRWRIDPQRSSVEFRVPHFYGLLKVKGRFERYEGTLDLSGDPAVELTIDAASLHTKQKARDKHLRSPGLLQLREPPARAFQIAHLAPRRRAASRGGAPGGRRTHRPDGARGRRATRRG
jgi:polyisoprenoid-binding protein YceI